MFVGLLMSAESPNSTDVFGTDQRYHVAEYDSLPTGSPPPYCALESPGSPGQVPPSDVFGRVALEQGLERLVTIKTISDDAAKMEVDAMKLAMTELTRKLVQRQKDILTATDTGTDIAHRISDPEMLWADRMQKQYAKELRRLYRIERSAKESKT